MRKPGLVSHVVLGGAMGVKEGTNHPATATMETLDRREAAPMRLAKADRPRHRQASREDWHALTAQFRDRNLQHCWGYAEAAAKRWNARVENLVIASGERV